MKKFIVITTIGMLFCISQAQASNRKTETDMPAKEAAELRKAVVDYKRNRSRDKAEQIINMYYGKYPNDPLVKAKMNEKTRFFLSDPSMQPSIATQFVEEGRTPETSMTPQVQPNMLTGTGDLTEEEQEALSSPLNPWTSDDSDLPLSSLKGSTTSQW